MRRRISKKKKRRKRKTRVKKSLPNKLICHKVKNLDKLFHEKWYQGRNILNIPHPFRGVLLGPPNVGKTSVALDILLRQNPPFTRVVVIHCNPKYTKEYDLLDEYEIYGTIPPQKFFDGKDKTLVILDDIDFKNMKKQQEHRLNRLYGNLSTHNNISCLLCSQDTRV